MLAGFVLRHHHHFHHHLTKLAALQFVSASALALGAPFVNLFLADAGFTGTQIGTLLSIGALLELAATPLLSALADRRGAHRALYAVFMLGFALANLIMGLTVNLLLLTLAVLVKEATVRPSITLGMQLVMTRLEREGRDIVGRVRSFSALGFGVTSLFTGLMLAVWGYAGLFLAAALVTLLSLLFYHELPQRTAEKSSRALAPRRFGFYLLAASLFFITMGMRAGFAFWLLHFQQNIGLSLAQIGLLSGFMALVEVPFFVLVDPLMRRLGAQMSFALGSVGMSLLWLGVGLVTEPIWIAPLLVFRGLVFALFHVAVFRVTALVSDPRNVATNQALTQITVPSIAAVLTGSISGWLFDVSGAPVFFAVCAAVSFVGIAIFLIGYRRAQPAPQATLAGGDAGGLRAG